MVAGTYVRYVRCKLNMCSKTVRQTNYVRYVQQKCHLSKQMPPMFPLSLRCRSWFPRKMDSRCGAAMVRTRYTRAATSRMRLAAVPLMVSTRDRLSLRRRGGPRKMHSRDGLAHALAKCQTLRVCVQILQSRLLHRCRAPSHSPSAL